MLQKLIHPLSEFPHHNTTISTRGYLQFDLFVQKISNVREITSREKGEKTLALVGPRRNEETVCPGDDARVKMNGRKQKEKVKTRT